MRHLMTISVSVAVSTVLFVACSESQATDSVLKWTQTPVTASGMGSFGMTMDSSGNVYIIGMSTGNLFGTYSTDPRSYAAKYTANGSLVWKDIWSNGSGLFGIAVDGSGNVSTGNRKYDASGKIVWQKYLTQSVNDVAMDSAGDSYVAGFIGASHPCVSKVNAAGDILWTSQYTGVTSGNGWYVGADAQGNSVIGGRSNYDAANHVTGFAARYDAAGNLLWDKQYSDRDVRDVAMDSAGNTYVSIAGAFIKYNAAGVQQWTKDRSAYPSSAIAIDPAGAEYLCDGYGVTKFDLSGNQVDYFSLQITVPSFDVAYGHGALGVGGTGGSGSYYVSAYSVPEPGTLAILVAAGVVGLLGAAARRRS
jgi:hypothetical protein